MMNEVGRLSYEKTLYSPCLLDQNHKLKPSSSLYLSRTFGCLNEEYGIHHNEPFHPMSMPIPLKMSICRHSRTCENGHLEAFTLQNKHLRVLCKLIYGFDCLTHKYWASFANSGNGTCFTRRCRCSDRWCMALVLPCELSCDLECVWISVDSLEIGCEG